MAEDLTYAPPARSALHLKTVSESGSAPKSRIRDAASVRNDVAHMVEANAERFRRWAMVKGMFQGNPPYNPVKLRNNGQGWRFNIATLEGKGLLSAGCAPYYDLFSSGQHYVEVHTDEGTTDEQTEWSQIITEEFDKMLKGWRSFDFRMQRLIGDFVGYGRGFLIWDNPLDWRFRYISHDSVLIPDCTEVDDEELKLFVIRRREHVTDLWKRVRDKESSSSAGWDVSEVTRAIRAAVPYEPTATHYDYDAVQDEINDADIYTYARDAYVKVAHYIVQEFSGKWTHCIVVEEDGAGTGSRGYTSPSEAHRAGEGQYDPGSNGESSQGPRFLYRAVGKYDDVYEILCPFIFEILDNTWNGVAGLGKDVFGAMQAKDRIRNSQLDNIIMRQSLLLKAQKASDRQKLSLVQVGPVTVIPENCDPIQAHFIGDIEGTLAVNTDLNNMLQMNLGIYRPQLQKTQGNPRTATEASLDFQQSTILGSAAVNRFYRQMDHAYDRVYRRVVDHRFDNPAREFIKRCKDRGVPEEALKNVDMVRAWRSVGNGSPFLRQQSLSMMGAVAPSFPEAGRVAWLRDYVSALANHSTANRYVPLPEAPKRTDDHIALAMLENSALNDPVPVKRTQTQNDVLHAQTHLEAMSGAISSLEQGADPAMVLTFLEAAGEHVMQHLQAASGDSLREGDVKALMEMLKQFGNVANELRSRVEQQQQQEQQEQQQQVELPMELQIKLRQIEGELALKKERQDAELKMASDKQAVQLRLDEEKARHDMQLDEKKVNQKMALEDAETAASIRNDSRKAEAASKSDDK